jgi:hypothetical protein
LGLFVAVELIVITTLAHVGTVASGTATTLRMLAFVVSLLVWIGYLLVPERASIGVEIPKRAQLEQWNQVVLELIHQ